jgi:hypothetical protein
MERRLIVKIRFRRSVDNLSDLARFAETLRFIDAETLRALRYDTKHRPQPRAKLITFHLGSPPELTFVVNPAWIAILIALIANYDKFKKNIPEIRADLERVIEDIRGLPSRKRAEFTRMVYANLELLAHSARLELEAAARRMMELERFFERAERNLARRRRQIVESDGAEAPEIEIVDLDDESD